MALQTKTYSLGSFDRYTGSSNGYILDLILTEEAVDLQANTSQVSYKLQLRSGPSNRFNWELTAALALEGVQVASATAERYLDYNSTWVLLEGSCDLAHDASGQKTLAFRAAVTAWNGGTQYTPPAMELADTMELTPIPRASTLAAAGACIGDTAVIAVSRKNSGYTHTVAYRFGTEQGYLADSTGTLSEGPCRLTETTLLLPLPERFYHQLPDSPTGTCRLVCTTYAGDTVIGTAEASFTVTADPARCGPRITGTAEDICPETLALTGDGRILVLGRSRVRCTVSAEALWGASIAEMYVNDAQISESVHIIENTPTAELRFTVRDSRGYTAAYTVPELTAVSYVPLSLHLQAQRTDPTGGECLLTAAGKWFAGSFGETRNTLTAACSVDGGDWQTLTPETDGGDFSLEALLTGLDYRTGHSLQLQVADRLQTLTKAASVSRGIPVFDWGENDFTFHVPVRFTASDGTVFTLALTDGQLTAIKEE